VTIESNRDSYFVTVSSPTLDDEALAALFGSRVVERDARGDSVVIRGQGSETLTLQPSSAVPYGTHEFRFRVNDSTARTTATLEVVRSRQTTARPSPETTTGGPTTALPTTETTRTPPPTTAMPTTSDTPTRSTTAEPTTTEPVTYVQGTTTGSGPGFGVVAALLALLGAALLARRR
jgi:PGF-CTERM protein